MIFQRNTLFFLFTFFTSFGLAQAQSFALESGVYYSQGDYHREKSTRITFVPIVIKYHLGRIRIKLTGGLLSLKGPGNIEAGSQTATEYDENGLADIFLASSYWWRTPFLKQIDWLAPEIKIKFPTADKNKALGTGEFDGQFLMGFYRIRLPLTLHSTISYRLRGDRADLNMNNSWGFNVGGVWKFYKFLDAGLMFDTEQASSSLSHGKREMVLHMSVKITRRVKATLYSQYGMSKGSPDFSIGTQVGYKF